MKIKKTLLFEEAKKSKFTFELRRLYLSFLKFTEEDHFIQPFGRVDFPLDQQKKIGEIQLSTNGTIIPEYKILLALKKANVLVYVSGYPSNIVPHGRN